MLDESTALKTNKYTKADGKSDSKLINIALDADA